ncbi:TRAP dicarboxylate transporter, DctQ subunit [Candidatus Terasakiella magnetica]|uniref:TRAP transporter small permease protein n=1 Tax=Candidatus Terasakiella magnetica TaxID=1867952 RepID=A0A1C3RDI9_9PROT|nr:TRAP transporter small permease [Candidatus Terasakiella magnetica]SCA55363.1 TRAP dicarboxylate transporter, DctQ subunit [Candidatus Terasakiella magnetica]
MAGSANVLTDDSLLSQLDQKLNVVGKFLALISGLAVFSLMILAVMSVGGRNFFNHPLPGYVDWIEQAMPLIAFMGVSYVQRNGGHIRMDMVVSRLKGRFLYAAELITTLAILIVMVLVVWGSWEHFLRSFDFSAPLWSRDSSMDIALPLWPAKLLAPVAFGVLCLQLILQAWGYLWALISGTNRPVGVPLIEDVATQAANEAEHVSGHDT